MQIHSIGSVGNLCQSRVQAQTQQKKSNFETSFGSIYINGEEVLKATKQGLRNYAELLRTLPDSEIREATRAYGFLHLKRQTSNEAYRRLTEEIRAVQQEVDRLQKSNNPKDKERLHELYDMAEKGRTEYYKEEPSPDVEMYQDTIEGMSEDIRSYIM